MKKYIVGYSGISQALNYEIVEATDETHASEIAYDLACSDYESYDGLHGIGLDDDEEYSEEAWLECREGWLEYTAEEYSEERWNEVQ